MCMLLCSPSSGSGTLEHLLLNSILFQFHTFPTASRFRHPIMALDSFNEDDSPREEKATD